MTPGGQNPALTRNQTLVLDRLTGAGEPLTAYTLLDQLRGKGLRAPVQIYRALEPLLDQGLVHRLESLNAYIACSHAHTQAHTHAETTIFAICNACGEVGEFADEAVESRILARMGAENFQAASTIVEIRGTCQDCGENELPPKVLS